MPGSLTKLALERGGCFTLSEARDHGLSRHEVVGGCRRRLLTRRQRGVYSLVGASPTDLQRAWATVLAVGAPAAVSGVVAARLHGLRMPARLAGMDLLEIAAPSGRAVRSRRDLRVRVLDLPWAEAVVDLGDVDAAYRDLPILGVPWLISELARMTAPWELARLITAADAQRMATVGSLMAVLDARGRVPGCRMLERTLGKLTGELSHSGEEALARRLLRSAGLPVTRRPHLVRDEAGRKLAEIDIAVVALRYGVEVDGLPHLWPARQAEDRRRDRALAGLEEPWVIERWFGDEISRDPQTGEPTRCRASGTLLPSGSAAYP